MTFDWKIDKASYAMITFILATMIYYIIHGAGKGLGLGGYIQVFLIGVFSTIALIGLACIPVIIACYFIKKIPDIDYAVWLAFGMTIVGIITELL
ncbi:MAG TPA: hypothetical protein PKD85_11355 [Saprospiraceae bacterium]|nr:hypothetical protein [Saprospiraceae bacterium]